MLIGIDANEANVKDRVGVNNYAFEILWGIYKLQDEWKDHLNFIIYLSQSPLNDLPKETKYWKYKILPGAKWWVLTKLTPHLIFSKSKPDLFFSPSHYTLPFSMIPRISSIMDLGYLDFSEQFKKITFWQLKYWTAISIFVSKYIIAISDATKREIVRHYPFASKKIHVIHLGYDSKKYNTEISEKDVRRIKEKYSIVDDYILFLSTLKPSKNLKGVLEAFSLIKDKKNKNLDFSLTENIKLVVAGKKGWMYEENFNMVKRLGIEKEVVFTGFVDEEDKAALYRGAKCLVSPSFTEGFGLHVLESMACGSPVVVSNLGSLPELVGDAGIIVDPNKIESIALGIVKILNLDEKGYNLLRNKVIKQAGKFTWDQSARKTLKLFLKDK